MADPASTDNGAPKPEPTQRPDPATRQAEAAPSGEGDTMPTKTRALWRSLLAVASLVALTLLTMFALLCMGGFDAAVELVQSNITMTAAGTVAVFWIVYHILQNSLAKIIHLLLGIPIAVTVAFACQPPIGQDKYEAAADVKYCIIWTILLAISACYYLHRYVTVLHRRRKMREKLQELRLTASWPLIFQGLSSLEKAGLWDDLKITLLKTWPEVVEAAKSRKSHQQDAESAQEETGPVEDV